MEVFNLLFYDRRVNYMYRLDFFRVEFYILYFDLVIDMSIN